jgi:integrase
MPDHSTALTPYAHVGQVANQIAGRSLFTDYRSRLAANTRRRQDDDLQLFSAFLAQASIVVTSEQLASDAQAWERVTWGLVSGFVRWQEISGYAIGSINVRLATVKAYCKLAQQSGALSAEEFASIQIVKGYRHKEGRNVDQAREITRLGAKKEGATVITGAAARRLKTEQPHTPQGRRDTLLMCLLLDHGLRVGELAGLDVAAIDLQAGTLTFYREKVDIIQRHKLTPETQLAVILYLQNEQPHGKLLMGSRKGQARLVGGMSARAICERVRALGAVIGLIPLSPHDCRHYWATSAVKGGSDIRSLQEAGGWSSPAMPLRYAQAGKIANAGIRLG